MRNNDRNTLRSILLPFILMRIDLKKVAKFIPFEEIMDDVAILPPKLRDSLIEKKWAEYVKKLSEFAGGPVQLSLF